MFLGRCVFARHVAFPTFIFFCQPTLVQGNFWALDCQLDSVEREKKRNKLGFALNLKIQFII
jgi:hypothetical protein